jgi:hypothetical protein
LNKLSESLPKQHSVRGISTAPNPELSGVAQ